MSEAPERDDVEQEPGLPAALLVRDRWWLGLAVAPVMLAWLLIPYEQARRLWIVAAAIAALFAVFIAAAAGFAPRRDRAEGRLVIDADALRWNGRRWIARRKIRQADWRSDPKHGAVVHLRLTNGLDTLIALANPDLARSVVGALGFGAAERTASFTAMSPAFSLGGRRRAAIAAATFMIPAAMFVAAVAYRSTALLFASMATVGGVALALVAWLGLRTRVVVGTDGVSLRWLWLRRFIPFADVQRVEATNHREFDADYFAIEVASRTGPPRKLVVASSSDDVAVRDVLLERMRDALASHRRGDSTADAASLARRDRDPDAWLRALRSRGAGADADLRTAPIAAERLWALVEDASAPPGARAAAAVAVSSDASRHERERIRIAARATASAELRIALERAAEEEADDEALAASLVALDNTRTR